MLRLVVLTVVRTAAGAATSLGGLSGSLISAERTVTVVDRNPRGQGRAV